MLFIIVNFISLLGTKSFTENCPPGFVPRTLAHSIASSLILNTNDIQRGTPLCIDSHNKDEKNKNGTGASFFRGWHDGKTLPVPEDAFLGDLKQKNQVKQERQGNEQSKKKPLAGFFEIKSSLSSQAPGGESLIPNACTLKNEIPSPKNESQLADNNLNEESQNDEGLEDPGEDRLFNPSSNLSTDPSGLIRSTASDSEKAARELSHQELLNSILSARKALYDAIQDDDKTTSEPYRKLPFTALGDFLIRAKENLEDLSQILSHTKGGIDSSEKLRFGNLAELARDKSLLGLGAFQGEMNRQSLIGATSALNGLLAPPEANPLARTPELSEIFGNPGSILNSENLVNRLVLFNGLSPRDKAELLKRIKLSETMDLTLEDGKKRKINLLHNGYYLGGGTTGTDCSQLASSALPVEIRKGRFTTLDLRAMWIYRRKGVLPIPPKYKKERAEFVKKTSQAFIPINVYENEKLSAGDLLVYRLPWETTGHVFIVRTYDPKSLSAEVLEASQSAGTIRERTFALSTDPLNEPTRILRSGLFGLRLKPLSNKVCQYKGDSRSISGSATRSVTRSITRSVK